MSVNREHKDRLFRTLFGNEKYKENTLALYNALNDSNYQDTSELQLKTIEDAIYMGMKNDLAFIIHSDMSMYEHQSTYNPNMPIRGLIYTGQLYSKYIAENNFNIYSSKQIKLPSPQYYVFYNGTRKQPDRKVLRLSDAFENFKDNGDYEWTAVMLNVNYGHNKELMNKCKPLMEYSIFVAKVREYAEKIKSMEMAVDQAIDECIEEGILAQFLIGHKAEVKDMLITEYNEEKTMQAFAKEYFEDGEKQGIEIGEKKGIKIGEKQGAYQEKINTAQRMLDKGMDVETICDVTGLSVDEIEELK